MSGPKPGDPDFFEKRPRRMPDRSLKGRIRARYRALRGRPKVDGQGVGEGLTMGRHSYFKPQIEWQWGDTGRVSIGNFSSIAHDSLLMVGAVHPTDFVTTFALRAQFGIPGAFEDGMPVPNGDIVIGNDAYIGRQARVLGGVEIGDGAVVAAFAVVAKDVRPYAIVAGNPAREIKRRFTDDQIERLLRIRWWDWPDEKVLEAVPLLNGGSIEEFLDAHDPGGG